MYSSFADPIVDPSHGILYDSLVDEFGYALLQYQLTDLSAPSASLVYLTVQLIYAQDMALDSSRQILYLCQSYVGDARPNVLVFDSKLNQVASYTAANGGYWMAWSRIRLAPDYSPLYVLDYNGVNVFQAYTTSADLLSSTAAVAPTPGSSDTASSDPFWSSAPHSTTSPSSSTASVVLLGSSTPSLNGSVVALIAVITAVVGLLCVRLALRLCQSAGGDRRAEVGENTDLSTSTDSETTEMVTLPSPTSSRTPFAV